MDIERMRLQVQSTTHSSQLRTIVAQLVEAVAELDRRITAAPVEQADPVEPESDTAAAEEPVRRGPGRPRKAVG